MRLTIPKVPQDQLKRVKFSFLKKDWKKLIGDLDNGNETLRQLLGDSDKLARGRAHRNIQIPSSWKGNGERAQNLYNALASSWKCPCTVAHCANLLIGDWASNKLNESGRHRRVNCEFDLWLSANVDSVVTPQEALWDCHHVNVRSLPDPGIKTKPTHLSQSKPAKLSTDHFEQNEPSFPKLKSLLKRK